MVPLPALAHQLPAGISELRQLLWSQAPPHLPKENVVVLTRFVVDWQVDVTGTDEPEQDAKGVDVCCAIVLAHCHGFRCHVDWGSNAVLLRQHKLSACAKVSQPGSVVTVKLVTKVTKEATIMHDEE